MHDHSTLHTVQCTVHTIQEAISMCSYFQINLRKKLIHPYSCHFHCLLVPIQSPQVDTNVTNQITMLAHTFHTSYQLSKIGMVIRLTACLLNHIRSDEEQNEVIARPSKTSIDSTVCNKVYILGDF